MTGAPTERPRASRSIGLHYGATDISWNIIDVAHAAVERGLESVFLPEHTHIPTSRVTPFPLPGMELPERYKRLWNPYIALSFVAALTPLEVGTSVSLIAQHDPIVLAKTIASLDELSGGRFVLGAGFGWNIEEFESHGRPGSTRRSVFRESLQLMREIWTTDEASFAGEHHQLAPSWSWPKPRQRPHPPVFIGCKAGPRNFRDIVTLADGWLPPLLHWREEFPDELQQLYAVSEELGRDPATIELAVTAHPEDLGTMRRNLERFWELGVGRVLLDIPSAPRDEILPIMDSYVELLDHR